MGNEASSPTTTGAAAAGEGSHEEKLRAIRQMDSTIRQRLKGGVSYNMKVVLRGERGSGKSALLARLQGLPFKPEYAPTPEIQTATISWTGTAEGAGAVKVEVWDVVDRGIRPGAAGRGQGHRNKRSGNSMLAVPADEEDEEEGGGTVVVEDDDALAGIPLDLPMPPPASGGGGAGAGQHVALGLLDARMVDVYKQSQCAVFLVNPFSASALAYLGKEVPAVPRDIPVLLLLNFRDLLPLEESSRAASSSAAAGHRPVHVTLAALRGVAAAEAVRRGAGARSIHAFTCSMQNCFGLRALYQYLNLPFLAMKEALLARQLAATKEELAATGAAVGAAIEGESWPAFLQSLGQEEREPAAGASSARAPAALPAAAAPAAPVPQPQPAPRMGTAGQGVEESKRSSSAAAASSRRPPTPPPEQRPSRSATPSADGAGGAAALADVDDFAYRPTAARSELDDFLADAEEDEEERAEYAAALAARREEERRRASIAACLKPEAEAVVDDGEDKEEEEDEEVGGLGRSSSSSQRYTGLAPVHLDTSGGSVGSSLLASAPTVVVAPADVEEAAAQQEEVQQQHQQPATAAAADVTEEAPAAPDEAEGEQQQEEQEEAAESPAAPPATPAPTMAVEEDEDDLDDLGPGIAEVEDGASGGEDDDEPAGLPIAGQGVPAGFFDDDEEEEDGGFGTGIGGMGGIGGVPARPPAYPRPSAFQPASSGPSAQTKPSDAALAAAPKSGSSSGALSEAARAAIAMTMASLEQELGGSGSGSGSLAVTAQGGAQEAGERSGSSSSRKKHHAKEEKHERKKSSSSRKHKKKSSSEREGR